WLALLAVPLLASARRNPSVERGAWSVERTVTLHAPRSTLHARVAPRAVRQPAKKILLRIRPRVGDTLRTRFDQLVQSAGPAPHVEAVSARSNAMHVLSRSIVERVDDAGVVVLTITDSASFDASGIDPRKLEAARRAMRGRWVRLKVSPAGAMEMLEGQRSGAGGGPDADAITKLPGTLPESPVAVGG